MGISGSDVPLDTSKPSRYYVSECGSGKSADNPQRVQVSRDPPRNPWMSKFSFLAYSERRAGTQRIYVLQAGELHSGRRVVCACMRAWVCVCVCVGVS